MSNNVIDISSQESFFRTCLVPTGQIAQLYLKFVPYVMGDEYMEQLSFKLFDVLNLTAVYATNPRNPQSENLRAQIAPAVWEVMQTMVAALRQGLSPSMLRVYGIGILQNRRAPQISSGHTQALIKALQPADAQLRTSLAVLQKRIGYAPERRHDWLKDQTFNQTPLSQRGSTNRWRTFVRNTSWQTALELLRLGPDTVPFYTANAFVNRVGAITAAQLWQEVFSLSEKAESESVAAPAALVEAGFVADVVAEVVAEVAEPAKPAELSRLPEGVSVTSNSKGELRVRASFDPMQFLDAPRQKGLKAPGRSVSRDLGAQLQPRSFEQRCDLQTLSAGVARGHAWLVEQEATRETVVMTFDCWEISMKRQAVRKKFDEQFNLEERKLLAEVLAEDTAAA